MRFGNTRGFCGRDPMEYPYCEIRVSLKSSWGSDEFFGSYRVNGRTDILTDSRVYSLFFLSTQKESLLHTILKCAKSEYSICIFSDQHYFIKLHLSRAVFVTGITIITTLFIIQNALDFNYRLMNKGWRRRLWFLMPIVFARHGLWYPGHSTCLSRSVMPWPWYLSVTVCDTMAIVLVRHGLWYDFCLSVTVCGRGRVVGPNFLPLYFNTPFSSCFTKSSTSNCQWQAHKLIKPMRKLVVWLCVILSSFW